MASVLKIGLGFTPDGFEIVKAWDNKRTENVRLGDLFMVKYGSSFDGSALGYYHAGVYCSEEDEDVIHFRPAPSSYLASCSSSCCTGDVSKAFVDVFCGQDKCAIYRKKGGIPASFRKKVKQAMKEPKDYKLLEYNCIHFALELLEVNPVTTKDYITKITKYLDNSDRKQLEMKPLNV